MPFLPPNQQRQSTSLVPEELVDGFAGPVAGVQAAVGDLPNGVALAGVADDRAHLDLVDRHREAVAQQVHALAAHCAAPAAYASTRRGAVTAPRQLAPRQQQLAATNTP